MEIMTSCNYYECIATYSGAYKANRRIKPKGIVIHSTGAENPNLWRWVNDPEHVGSNSSKNYFSGENDERQVMPHAVFGYDINKEIAICHILPYDYRSWTCGSGSKGSFNDSHIQIEIAEDYGLTYDYLCRALNAVAEWAARRCIEYDIDVNNIVSHKEACALGYASNHGDPEHWLSMYNLTMNNFRAMVNTWISRLKETETDSNGELTHPIDVLYTVQVGAFSKYDNAKACCEKLKSQGIECFIKKVK